MTNAPNSLEPVAWMYFDDDEVQPFSVVQEHRAAKGDYPYCVETPLYDHPAPKPADSQLVEVVMRELGVQEMVMADPQTLKRLQAERILRALAPHLSPETLNARPHFRGGTADHASMADDARNSGEQTVASPSGADAVKHVARLVSLYSGLPVDPNKAEQWVKDAVAWLASGAHREAGE